MSGAHQVIELAYGAGRIACVMILGLKMWLNRASRCHTCLGWPAWIQNRSRIPSMAVAASSIDGQARVRMPGDVGQVPDLGVQVQPQAPQHLALLSDDQALVGE